MNGQEQRERGNAIKDLERAIKDLEVSVANAYEGEAHIRQQEDNHLRHYTQSIVGAECAARQAGDAENARQLQAHHMRNVMMDGCSVWRRLYWLVTGVWL